MAMLMTSNGYNSLPAFLSFTGVILALGGGLSIFLVGLAVLFKVFPAIQPILLNSDAITSIGLAYDIIGAMLISYDAVAGTGVLAQLLWYLKRKRISLSKRLLMLFYLLNPPLKREKDGINAHLNAIKRGKDVKNADLSKRAIGEPPGVQSEYDQFREIQRPAVIKWFGFVLLSLGFIMQFIAIHIPE
ncbi:hypothetical protein [Halorarum salinum]|uniref:Uncharacterized protein n=1 Tax=Halorarum salinum TaxID=2743089 RepID=A0A7D5QDJ3_9EURY|nr:hypothetical protein [Halobaculum salinum]QLG63320.1 hypothetical protein HUG12_16915 [Halobaculum salinum]